ncbi:MAG: aspartate kinase, partial [Cyclobacteriaceae bacterium]
LIYHELAEADLKVNLMQTSAISISIIMDYHEQHLEHILKRLKPHFSIKYNISLELITIKNYNPEYVARFKKGREILLEQISRNNYRAVMIPVRAARPANQEDFQ